MSYAAPGLFKRLIEYYFILIIVLKHLTFCRFVFVKVILEIIWFCTFQERLSHSNDVFAF